jgi:hypothetical protein
MHGRLTGVKVAAPAPGEIRPKVTCLSTSPKPMNKKSGAGYRSRPNKSSSLSLEATDIVLRVLSQSTQNKFQDTLFGFALVPVLASVYYDYAMHLARSDGAEFEILSFSVAS